MQFELSTLFIQH